MKTHEDNDIKIDATGNTYRQSFVDHLTEARDGEWTTQTGEEAILESKAEFEMLFNTKIIDNH